MTNRVRRTLGVISGISFVVVGFAWAVWAAVFAQRLIGHKAGVSSIIGEAAIYRKFGDVYTTFGLLGLFLACGMAAVMLTWDRRPSQHRIEAIFGLFLLLVLPLSFLNYWSGDFFVSRPKQAFVDTILVFLGMTATISLSNIQVISAPARVLKAMVLFFVVFQAVLIPGIYAFLWWLNWQGAVSLANTRDWTPGWISATSGICSLILSFLQYKRSGQGPATEATRIIKP